MLDYLILVIGLPLFIGASIMGIASIVISCRSKWIDYRLRCRVRHMIWLDRMGLIETGTIMYNGGKYPPKTWFYQW